MRIIAATTIFCTACVLLALDVEPAPTWFYVFAWYPTLVVADAAATRREHDQSFFASVSRVVSVFGWSAVLWLVYELANLRLQNWYYVFLPQRPIERWSGIIVSFATVLPAVFLAERLLRSLGVGKHWVSGPFITRRRDLVGAVILGVGLAALPLAWPRLFSPLIWGAGLLIADPYVYRRTPDRSLIGDVRRGEWGRIGRLALGGLAIGGLWECYNYWARGKWIYTVPFLEESKLFEMPPFGFLGFPVFALSAWSLYHALSALGVARDPERRSPVRPIRAAVSALVAAAVAVAALWGMERRTISSTVPSFATLPVIRPGEAERLTIAGVSSVFELAAANVRDIGEALQTSEGRAVELVETARLATLRGIGAEHVRELARAGVTTVCGLARSDPHELWLSIHALFRGLGPRPTQAEIRVWHRAARGACRR